MQTHTHTRTHSGYPSVSVKVAEKYPRVHHGLSQQTGDTQEPRGL